MKKLAFALAAALTATPVLADDAPKLVTIIASPDAQTQLMGMVLTFQSVQQGAEASIASLPRFAERREPVGESLSRAGVSLVVLVGFHLKRRVHS